ncbi:outer membrane beta-barrel protein [Taibaiella lutea]|uniref:Outer membrane beta-barrel protein n=1 Tax=Taibaiella lutea TaxID=2608001 RepID=A0A5M6CEL2_9BACT|nr:outer membrane beta-barrel protein [Taibaiella lutea]KAA5533638.1 outer membrane beta-barrel protein [Taibaiella lutea]
MKIRITFFTLLIASSISSFAQSNWTVGLRSGAELAKTENLDREKIGLRFSQQLFITKRLFKNFELELNAAYKSPLINKYNFGPMMDGPSVELHTSTTHLIEVGLSARYFVYNSNGWSPYLFGGLNIARTFSKDVIYNDAYFGWSGYVPEQTNLYKYTNTNIPEEFYIGAGLNKTITTKWTLNTQMSLDYNNSAQKMITGNDLSPKLQIGIAYAW